jgi:hypothetical protein
VGLRKGLLARRWRPTWKGNLRPIVRRASLYFVSCVKAFCTYGQGGTRLVQRAQQRLARMRSAWTMFSYALHQQARLAVLALVLICFDRTKGTRWAHDVHWSYIGTARRLNQSWWTDRTRGCWVYHLDYHICWRTSICGQVFKNHLKCFEEYSSYRNETSQFLLILGIHI